MCILPLLLLIMGTASTPGSLGLSCMPIVVVVVVVVVVLVAVLVVVVVVVAVVGLAANTDYSGKKSGENK